MSHLNELLAIRRWVFWLDRTAPERDENGMTGAFRVSIVIENESGHYPTGGGDKIPWYWDDETCKRTNAERGFTELDVFHIVESSMMVGSRVIRP